MKRFLATILILGLAQPLMANAQAPNFSYNSFGLAYANLDAADSSEDIRQVGINTSLAINHQFFAFVDHNRSKADLSNGDDLKSHLTSAGLGLVFPVKDKLDIVGKASYLQKSTEVCLQGTCTDATDYGYRLSAQANYWLTSNIDSEVALDYDNLDRKGSDTAYRFGVGYWPAKEHRLGFEYRVGDNYDAIGFNYRISQNLY